MNKNNTTKKLKFPNDFVNKIVCGDSLELVKEVPNESIDAIITDPPYGLNTKGINNDADLSIFYKSLQGLYRILKKDGWFITFFSTKFLPKLFENNPFAYFWQIVLYCPEGSVRSPIGITKFMSSFIFKKGTPKIIQKNKDIFKDTPGKLIEPDEGFINHPTPKPKHFMKKLMKMFTKEEGLILDPFIGSGSTAVACKQLKRRFIGFEINPKYVKLANNRLKKYRQ